MSMTGRCVVGTRSSGADSPGDATLHPPSDDLERIERASRGDRAAYADLLHPLMADATRLAFGLLRDWSEGEDAVQEAAILAWQRLNTLRANSRFRRWFLRIVTNRCRERWRSRWWSETRVPELRLQEWTDHDTWLAEDDLRRAVAALPHGQRAAILLHYYMDLSVKEVAATLGLSEAGVKSRLNRGLRRLRVALGAEVVVAS
jgi:RNA polymerase sigma-70 factor, ECF subfamily